ncbi:MAG: hypothetical protein WEB87_06010 [Bacteriovoracaceae bacterium]
MFSDDIEQLVSETFQEAQFYKPGEQGFFFDEETEKPDEINFSQDSFDRDFRPPDVPGVLYYLQKNSSTFVLRILPARDLRLEWEKVVAAPENYPSLRLLSAADADERTLQQKLDFFECDSLQLAKELKENLANKRFPLHEERVINVGDPGDNWWIKPGNGDFTVYFKLSRTESMNELVKAGPLADIDHSLAIFSKLYGYFSLLFPIKDFSSGHGQFSLGCEDPQDDLFKELMDIFLKGEFGNRLWERLRQLEQEAQEPKYLDSLRRANYFLMSIAASRSFWRKIQDQLEF